MLPVHDRGLRPRRESVHHLLDLADERDAEDLREILFGADPLVEPVKAEGERHANHQAEDEREDGVLLGIAARGSAR